MLLLVALVLCSYTAARTRISWYIIPVYPALAILVAHLIVAFARRDGTSAKLCAALVCVLFVYLGARRFAPLYSEIDPVGTPIRKLSLVAKPTHADDREPLLIFSAAAGFDKPEAVFYSERTVQQATTSAQVANIWSPRRYVDFKPLSQLTDATPRRILLRRDELPPLLDAYDIHILAEADPLIYATIEKRAD
ncbi:MAG TPA: hypothetical protein VGV59_14605 [Pyrinomonadaceae bacterium]|nr:hypothetical protein [Pyrinomonadaceae bacterium]